MVKNHSIIGGFGLIQPIITKDVIVLPQYCPALDQSYRAMCSEWCRWVISIPKQESPTIYETNLMRMQASSVNKTVFLCQAFDFQYLNTGIDRCITIPPGWSIFMPVINWVSVLEKEEKGNEKYFRRLAEERMDEAANLNVKVNGIPIPLCFNNFRVKSISDKIVLPKHNLFDMEPTETSYVADGFWIFFRPLTSDLTLETYASCQSGIIQISSKYRMVLNEDR
jgi:hypothetical protein